MRRLWAGVLALAAVAAVGCGGGDDGGDTTATTPPPAEVTTALAKEELIAQGDAICAEVNAAVGTLAASDAGTGAGQAAALYGGMAERLKELGAPSDDTAGYDEFIAAAEALAQAESDVELAVERGEGGAVSTAESEASSVLASFQSAASAYGFEQCGEGPSALVATAPTGEEPAEEPAEGIEEEVLPEAEAEEEVAPEAGGAGAVEEGAGGGAAAGGTEGGGEASGGGTSGGVGPG